MIHPDEIVSLRETIKREFPMAETSLMVDGDGFALYVVDRWSRREAILHAPADWNAAKLAWQEGLPRYQRHS